MLKKLLIIPFVIFSLFISMHSLADISDQTQHYLNQKNFTSARSSVESDLLSQPYDAKAWYFYSRILMNLDMPNAAKIALNNAMNIDKNFNFAKKGLPQVKAFANEIQEKIDDNRMANINEPYINIKKIKSSDYKEYLDGIFGKGHNFGNLNNPTDADFRNAKLNKNNSINRNVSNDISDFKSTVLPQPQPKITPKVKTPEEIQKEKEGQEKFERISKTVFAFILFILIVLALGGFIFNRIKNKKLIAKNNAYQIEQNNLLFEKLNGFSKVMEDKIKDLDAIAPSSVLLNEYRNIYGVVLDLIKNVDINNPTNSRNKIEKTFSEIDKKYKSLEHYRKLSDFDLTIFKKDEAIRLEKERVENERLAKQREKEAEERAIMLQKQNEERKRRKAIEEEQRRKNNNNSSSNSGGRSSTDLLTGIILGSEILRDTNKNNSNKSSNNRSKNNWDQDDDNTDIWNSKSRKSHDDDNDNDSFWSSTSKSHSNDDSNSGFWKSSGGSSSSGFSKGSKNSDDW